MKLNSKIFPKFHLTLFDIALIGTLIMVLLIAGIILFRKNEFVDLTMRITNNNVLYSDHNPPLWYAYTLKKGSTEKDSIGRIQSEIINVQMYPLEPGNKAVFVNLRLNAVYNKSKQQYSYKGKPLLIGSGLRVELQNHLIEGVITDIANQSIPREEKTIILKAKVIDTNPVYGETEGVSQYIADAININDSVVDYQNNKILTIIDKKVVPSERYTFNSAGGILLNTDPKRVDVYLTLKTKVRHILNEDYFMGLIRIRVGGTIPIDLPKITIYPVVTDIFSE